MTTLLFSLSLTIVLYLLLRPGIALFHKFQKKKHIAARRERRHEMFAVNPHRSGSKRDRYLKAHFLTRQNDETFNDDIKFVFGTVFEIDNSNVNTDTRNTVRISRKDFEAAMKWIQNRHTRRLRIQRAKIIINQAASSIVRSTKKLMHVVIRRTITYIHHLGGKSNHAPNKEK